MQYCVLPGRSTISTKHKKMSNGDQTMDAELVESFNYLFKKIESEMKSITGEEDDAGVVAGSRHLQRKNWLRFFECDIKMKRVIRIVDKLIKFIELCFTIERMIDDRSITQFVDDLTVMEGIMKVRNDVVDQEDMESTLSQIIGTLSSSNIWDGVSMEQLPESRKRMIDNLLELKRILVYKLRMIAPKDLIKEKIFHQMFRSNEKNKEKIEKLEVLIRDEEEKLEQSLEEKYRKIEWHENEIDKLGKMSEHQINSQVQKSQEAMIDIYTKSEKIKSNLKQSVNLTVLKYEKILSSNLQHQNEIRDKKSQVQNTLKQCVTKYDKDIGDRFNELNDLQASLDQKMSEFDVWNLEFLRQENEYVELMLEKEAEEKRKQEEKVLLFVMHRSAITIQRAWRRVLAKKKKSKKKGKKGKK